VGATEGGERLDGHRRMVRKAVAQVGTVRREHPECRLHHRVVHVCLRTVGAELTPASNPEGARGGTPKSLRRPRPLCHSRGMRIPSIGGAVLAALSLAAAHPVAAKDAPTNPYPGYHSAVYADPSHWLCRGDTDDVCDHELDAAIVKASGKTSTEHWKPGRHPRFDCFYVYPTISSDPLGNSDLVPDPDAELFVVRQQAARLGTVCRVFAAVYPQGALPARL